MCPGGRAGVDIHPSFNMNAEMLRQTSAYVEREFLPRLKALATCQGGVVCRDENDRMSFVDAHQQAFARSRLLRALRAGPRVRPHVFLGAGQQFSREPARRRRKPARLQRLSASEFRPYASRARWVRTPNDSYFAAMTFPDGFPSTMQPADIHDALWGVLSAVYGGAIHPTAEGHAAMADAALETARDVLIERGSLRAGEVRAQPCRRPKARPQGT